MMKCSSTTHRTKAIIICIVLLATGCGGGSNPCSGGEGSGCKINTMNGYCQIDNINGGAFCVPTCKGAFDFDSCSYDTYSACYPVFKDKFGCLGKAYPSKKEGEDCSQNNECDRTLVCIDWKCTRCCEESPEHACPLDGGTCVDIYGFGWKVCR